MTEEISGEYMCHVLYSEDVADKQRVIIFAGEFNDAADAEERKAHLNQNIPNKLSSIKICVGLAHFHAHPTDESQDFALITPKDGSQPFMWHQMIDMHEILELAEVNGL
jgi:hypothetical protein